MLREKLVIKAVALVVAIGFCVELLPVASASVRLHRLDVGGCAIDVSISSDTPRLTDQMILEWIANCARAVSAYYGAFPVKRLRIEIEPREGSGVGGGVTHGHSVARIRIAIGRGTRAEQLPRDWKMVHEMVHTGFPSMRAHHAWIEEGLATYVEPFARARIGQLTESQVWTELARDLPQGLPQEGDRGLDRTQTWASKYWGGALFCLMADVRLRTATQGRMGLEDALHGIVRAGGNVTVDWSLEQALRAGDEATGTTVLRDLHALMGPRPHHPDLGALLAQLGVARNGDAVRLDDAAPLAPVRRAITFGARLPVGRQLRRAHRCAEPASDHGPPAISRPDSAPAHGPRVSRLHPITPRGWYRGLAPCETDCMSDARTSRGLYGQRASRCADAARRAEFQRQAALDPWECMMRALELGHRARALAEITASAAAGRDGGRESDR